MRSYAGQTQRRRGCAALAALVAAVALGAAGCGSDDNGGASTSSKSASSSGAGSSAGLREAQAALKDATTLPTQLGLPKHEKPIPSGKSVAFVHCGVAVCNTVADAIKNAAGILGWKTTVVPTNGTPASVKAAWKNVARMNPDVVFNSGFDKALFAAELKQLAAKDIPVFSWTSLDKPGGGITYTQGGPEDVPIVGKQMAAWVVSENKGKANTLYVELPTFVILKPVGEGFEENYKKWCPDCPLAKMQVPVTAIGKDAPNKIVAYLRSHPDVNTVAVDYDGVAVGLPAALKAAGLDKKVKLVGEAPTATNLSYVQAGTEGATVHQGYYEIWAHYVDAAARHLTGQSLAPNEAWTVPWFLVTKENIAEANGTKFGPIIDDLNDQLKQIWGKTA